MTLETAAAAARTTESEIVAAQYRAWVYPQPVEDLAAAVAGGYWDMSDPALIKRKLWPRNVEPEDLDILIAGCGTNQAACYAYNNPRSRVVGIDISDSSLGHEAYLKERNGLANLELRRMSLGDVASLGRSFDLIVSTGVLHHLPDPDPDPDPDAGLRCLRDVLRRPHGVLSVMVYGYYPRFGVYMMQELFRNLGLRQDADAVALVRRAVNDMPRWHYVRNYMEIGHDLGYDSGLVDTFLHPLDQHYTVPKVLRFARDNGLKLQSWLDEVDYSISACIADPTSPLRLRVEGLPVEERWTSVELIGQSLATHRFLLCHPGRPEADYVADFDGEGWLDYVPSFRFPARITRPDAALGRRGARRPADPVGPPAAARERG